MDMPQKRHLFVTSKDGTSISYRTMGTGPVLLYITGASCFKDFFPIKQDVKVLSQSFTVVWYDRRGRGESTDVQPYSAQREIEDIEALIDELGQPIAIYGHSSGAVLALEAGLQLKNKISKIAVYDPSYVHNEEEKESYRKLSDEVQQLLTANKNSAAMKRFLSGIGMPKLFVYALPLVPGWKTMKALAPTLMYDIALTKDLINDQSLKNLQLPVLLLAGSKSPEGIRQNCERLDSIIKDSSYHEVSGQDHMVKPERLLTYLEPFLLKDVS